MSKSYPWLADMLSHERQNFADSQMEICKSICSLNLLVEYILPFGSFGFSEHRGRGTLSGTNDIVS